MTDAPSPQCSSGTPEPCPFCASAAEPWDANHTSVQGFEIVCTNAKCGACTGLFPTKPMALKAWNKRATSPTPQIAGGVRTRKWDEGEHEGCGIDSQRALDRSGAAAQAGQALSRDDLAGLLANAMFSENLTEMPVVREEFGPSWCQDDMRSAAEEILSAGYVVTKAPLYASPPAALPAGAAFEPKDAWNELVHKDDRTSPEEYPEMCLITFHELYDFMDRATALPSTEQKTVPNILVDKWGTDIYDPAEIGLASSKEPGK